MNREEPAEGRDKDRFAPDDAFAEDAPAPDDGFAEDDEEVAGDEDVWSEEDNHTALPPKMEAWRRRSAAGAILTGFALGLQEALEPKREEPGIVVQASGDPPEDLAVESDFEYRRPRQSVVHIRPWLLTNPRDQEEQAEGPADQDGS